MLSMSSDRILVAAMSRLVEQSKTTKDRPMFLRVHLTPTYKINDINASTRNLIIVRFHMILLHDDMNKSRYMLT